MLPKKKDNLTLYKHILTLFMMLSVLACSTDKTAMKEEPLFVPEDTYSKANELIEDRYYDDARTLLETIITKDASQKYAVLARLRIADTYYNGEFYDEAVIEYESFLKLYPYHKYASYAQYMLAMSFFKRMKTVDISYTWAQKALVEFQKLQRRYPRNPYMNLIDGRIKTCRNMLAEYEYYVANFYYDKGSYKAAIGRFDGMLKNYPDSSRVPEALYYMGVSYENLGQRDEAINNLTVLIEEFPTTEISIEAKKLVDSFDKVK